MDQEHYRETSEFNIFSDSISLDDKIFGAWNNLISENKIKSIKESVSNID